MPNNLVKSIADEADISTSKAEEYWNRAKEQVKDEYDDVEEGSDRFYKLVTSITKKMAGLEESYKERKERKRGNNKTIDAKEEEEEGSFTDQEDDESGSDDSDSEEDSVQSFDKLVDKEIEKLG